MKKSLSLALCLCFSSFLFAQDIYFPPLLGNEWATTSPAELAWCESELPALYEFLEDTNTKAFLVLQDGKIVLEKYFGTFAQDSIWYWASAGKSLTALAVGIAQEEGLLDLEDASSDYLGAGWTASLPDQEAAIKIRHQLSMTSGLDDTNSADCTDPDCLKYLADAGTRWAYHNGPYTLLSEVIEAASGQTFNAFVNSRIGAKIGMWGSYISTGYNKVYFSRARSMARYGLLILNNGVWDGTSIISDQDYLQQMLKPSQNINEAYGYLWWLNGGSSYMLPTLQFVFNGQPVVEAPEDMVCAMGKNGQFINVVPSKGLLVIRMGDNPGGNDFVPNFYNSDIWEKLNPVICNSTAVSSIAAHEVSFAIRPNPVADWLTVEWQEEGVDLLEGRVFNAAGELKAVFTDGDLGIELTDFPAGVYLLQVLDTAGKIGRRRFVVP